MKTASLTYHSPRLIDTAPLAARYTVLTKAILAFIAAGQMGEMLRLSHKAFWLVQVFSRLQGKNVLTQRKLDMLLNTPWRERGPKELGGLRKLKLWDAAKARIEDRAAAPRKRILEGIPLLPLTDALSPKVYNDLFGSLTP